MRGSAKNSTVRHTRALALILVLVLAVAGQILNAREHNGQSENSVSPQTTLRATSEAVLVPVVVTDAGGKPVTGLKREDFAIYADGKPQTIANFEEVQVTQTSAGTEPHPNRHSNYIADSKSSARPVILLIDYLNSRITDQRKVRDQILHFLDTQLESEQPVELFFLTDKGLRLLQSFTTSTADLKAAVLGLREGVSPADRSASDQQLVADQASVLPTNKAAAVHRIQTMIVQADRFEGTLQTDAIRTTLDAMSALASGFGGIPGRKNLIWLTAGFPFQVTDPDALGGSNSNFTVRYQQAWQKLSDANVAVYPVDMRGLFDSQWNLAAPDEATDSASLHAQYGLEPQIVDPQVSVGLTLAAFARETSGSVCVNNNDLPKCLASAARDGENNYFLAFSVSPEIHKKGWHTLKVVVDKQRGLKVRSREGFFVGNEKAPAANQTPGEAVLAAVRSPVPFTALPFSVEWVRQEPASSANPSTRLTKNAYSPTAAGAVFRIALPPLAFAVDSSDSNHVQLDIAAVAIDDASGKPAGDYAQEMTAHLKPESLGKIESNGLTFENAIALPVGSFQVRFVIRDAISGKVGSVDAPIQVAP